MHIEAHGTGRPLFFLHGWRLRGSVEAADYEPIFNEQSGWRRLYVDLPGMGVTPADPAIEDADGYLAAILETIETHAPRQPFAIAGTSFGADLARHVADELNDRACGLLLRVPRLIANEADREVMSPETARFETEEERDLALDQDDAGDIPMPPAFYRENELKRRHLWAPAREASDTEFLTPIRDTPHRYAFRRQITRRFDRPALIISGRQDSRVGHNAALSILSLYPRATVAVLDRAGHALPTGDPSLFRAFVSDWLTRVTETIDG